ncbi:MAG: diaminopimelate decarboxylase [Candidatus Omnitrophica bacterium]|jgi:diaminopimelate decarboxylase|nr:diaminopimelate decarboxylase [Candidatus Omnitrophota bacterium]
MHYFQYKNNRLFCEDADIQELAVKHGTPLYLYSYKTLVDHFVKLTDAFSEIDALICYSVKANSNLSILKALVKKGAGLDIVSGGELFRALRAGCPPERIVYASVGKTAQEIKQALQKGILFFNVESIPELENINRIAGNLNKTARVALRINPDVEAKTHKYITTGKLTNKFGIDLESARRIFGRSAEFPNLRICGIHIHIGSQITQSAPFVAAIRKIAVFIDSLKKDGICLQYLNIGGGLGIVYNKETPQTAAIYASKVMGLLKKTGLKIILEPGRFIVGNSGILLAKVLYVKKTFKKNFIIVDAAMNDLIRPALYEAYHEILPLVRFQGGKPKAKSQKFDVVGPICESGDYFAKGRLLPQIKEGDYLAIMSAGAYGFSMSSNYNSRCRAQEVMVVGKKDFVIRNREIREDLIRNEKIPQFLRRK